MHPDDYAALVRYLGTAPWMIDFFPTCPGCDTVSVMYPAPKEPDQPSAGDDDRHYVAVLGYNGRSRDGLRHYPTTDQPQSGDPEFFDWSDEPRLYETLPDAQYAMADLVTTLAEGLRDNA